MHAFKTASNKRSWLSAMVTRGVLFTTLLSILVLGGIADVAYVLNRNRVRDQVADQLSSVVVAKTDEVSRWLGDQQVDFVTITRAPSLQVWGYTLSVRNESDPNYADAYANLLSLMTVMVRQQPELRELSFLKVPDGRTVVSTNPAREGEYRGTETYFEKGFEGLYTGRALVSPGAGRTLVTLSAPVYGEDGAVLGVLVGELDLDWLQMQVLGRSGLAPRWERYLVDRTFRLVVGPGSSSTLRPELWSGGVTMVRGGPSGTGVYLNSRDERVVGAYRWIEELDLALLLEVNYAYAVARPVNQAFLRLLPAGLLAILLFAVGSYLVIRRLLRPLHILQEQMALVMQGDLEPALDRVIAFDAPWRERGTGTLLGAFQQMVARLRDGYRALGRQVDARTASLQRRSLQLDAAARISSTISAIRNVEDLLDETVRLIPEYFDFDHVGVFLRDETGDYIVLQAASSEGGQRMLARGHQLRLGQGIVGAVAQSGQPRIALDVGEDPVFFTNPDLPDTHSEMALPLAIQGRLIGVLDVQSQTPAAFTEEDVAVLQSMADQVALAIESARLLQESGEFLRELRRRYGEQVGQAWMRRTQGGRVGFRYTGVAVEPLKNDDPDAFADLVKDVPAPEATLAALEDGGLVLRAPIMVRDYVLGHVVLRRASAGDATAQGAGSTGDGLIWDERDIALVNAVCVQIGQALENARLLDEAQVRADFEQLTGDISERIRSSAVNVDSVLQTTLRELGVALGARGTIKFNPVDQWSQVSGGNGDEPA